MKLMLDPRLLQAFVAVAETGSFTAAATRLHSTQSTVSQQIARLERGLRQTLIDRGARPVALTPPGERLIGYARRIVALQTEAEASLVNPSGSRILRIGLQDDLVNSATSREFAEFARRHPEVRVDLTTGLSRDISRRFRDGEFDIGIVKEPRAQADARATVPEPLAWFEAADRTGSWPEPLPLVAFPPGGLYRETMVDMIEGAGMSWYLSFTGNSLPSVLHAVEAGLGLAILPISVVGSYRIREAATMGPVPAMALSIYAWEHDEPTFELVSAIASLLSRA